MSKASVSKVTDNFRLTNLLSIVFLVLLFSGCASPPATTGPGTPDVVQLQHYDMVKSAIDSKSKPDALAALALLQADVSRWRENTIVIMKAFVDLGVITDAVDKEDWVQANKLFMELTLWYRNT